MSSVNDIPNGWMETALGDITSYINRGITPKYTLNTGIYVLNQRCIRDHKVSYDNARLNDLNLRKVSEDKKVRLWDILICSTGTGTLGRVAQITDKIEPTTVDSHVTIVRPVSSINQSFLGQLLKGKEREIEYLAEGSTGQTELPRKKLGTFPLIIPQNINEQKAIANILTAFDDKIENLEDQNKTLEQTAQTIFKEWFGKYQVGDELPNGWRVGKLSELGKVICGKTPSKSNKDFYGEEVPFIKIPDMHNQVFIISTTDNLSVKGADSQKNKILPANSICVSCIATVGLVSLTIKDSQTNQQINAIIPNNEYLREFIYLKLSKMTKYLNDLGSGGTATLNVNTSTFSNIEIVIPKEYKLKEFNKLVSPIFEKILSNVSQIQTLKKTRDTLLPKLMSGKIRVNKFKESKMERI